MYYWEEERGYLDGEMERKTIWGQSTMGLMIKNARSPVTAQWYTFCSTIQ
jgi:hypothetical protein